MIHLPTGKTRKEQFVRVTQCREQHKPSNLIVSPLLVGLGGKSLEPKGICNAGFSKHAFGIHKEKERKHVERNTLPVRPHSYPHGAALKLYTTCYASTEFA